MDGARARFTLTFDELRWQMGAGVLLYLAMAAMRYVAEVGGRLREQEARVASTEALRAGPRCRRCARS